MSFFLTSDNDLFIISPIVIKLRNNASDKKRIIHDGIVFIVVPSIVKSKIMNSIPTPILMCISFVNLSLPVMNEYIKKE
jgi:hypothetical protein